MSEVTFAVPGQIDGTPEAVEEVVLEQLPSVVDAFAEFIDDAAKQLANAERSRLLKEDSDATLLADRYAATNRAGQLARLIGAAKALCSVAAEID